MKVTRFRLWLTNLFTSNNKAIVRKKRPIPELQLLECRTVPATLDVSQGTVSFTAATGFNDNVSVSLVNNNYTVTDSSETISLTSAASAAGWTGSGTNA